MNGNANHVRFILRKLISGDSGSVNGGVIAGPHYQSGGIVTAGSPNRIQSVPVDFVDTFHCIQYLCRRIVDIKPPFVCTAHNSGLVEHFKDQMIIIIRKFCGNLLPHTGNELVCLLKSVGGRAKIPGLIIMMDVKNHIEIILSAIIHDRPYPGHPFRINPVIRS